MACLIKIGASGETKTKQTAMPDWDSPEAFWDEFSWDDPSPPPSPSPINPMKTNHHLHFPVGTLTYNGNLILTAAGAHPEIAPRLPDKYLGATGTLLQKLPTDVSSQKTVKGEAGNLTAAQQANVDSLLQWMFRARKTARLAFAGQTVKLHQEFQTGKHDKNDLAAILGRADIILTSIQDTNNMPALQARGWSAADTTAFKAVRATFATSPATIQSAAAGGKDATTSKTGDAEDFYERLLTIQNAADLQWPATNPANAGVRDEFRLNTFPPERHTSTTTPTPTPAPTTTTAKP
jgi:hypothetical protein